MQPTVGRIVHYQSYGTPGGEYQPEVLAAIITAVSSPTNVDLFVLYPNGSSHKADVPYSSEPAPGWWSWPPRTG